MTEVRSSHSDEESFIKSLREQTAVSHKKLEENYLSKMILNDQVSIVDYQNYLSALYGVTLGCETDLFPFFEDIITDLHARKRSGLIENDLISTGFSKSQVEAVSVYKFAFSSTAEALGAMYVLEGSNLGGRILYKHIHKSLGLTADNGCSYFWGYGENTSMMWKTFISQFSQFAIQTGQAVQIINGAVETFTIIDTWLDEAVIEK
jgi:heme oxygenase